MRCGNGEQDERQQDEEDSLVDRLAGVNDENVDDVLARTPGFQAMIARSRKSLQEEPTVSAGDLIAEARATLAEEQKGLPSSEEGPP